MIHVAKFKLQYKILKQLQRVIRPIRKFAAISDQLVNRWIILPGRGARKSGLGVYLSCNFYY